MNPPRPVGKGRMIYCDCGEVAVYQIGNAKICGGCYKKDHSVSRRDKSKSTGDGRGLPVYIVNLPESQNDAS
jgi:hypothetical protein